MTVAQSIKSDYLTLRYGQLKILLDKVIREISKSGLRFESIAFSGVSGGLAASYVAMAMKKHLIVVRKPRISEKSHSAAIVEGSTKGRYIILDDFIDSGKTVQYIKKQIDKATECQFVAIALYDTGEDKSIFKTLAEYLEG